VLLIFHNTRDKREKGENLAPYARTATARRNPHINDHAHAAPTISSGLPTPSDSAAGPTGSISVAKSRQPNIASWPRPRPDRQRHSRQSPHQCSALATFLKRKILFKDHLAGYENSAIRLPDGSPKKRRGCVWPTASTGASIQPIRARSAGKAGHSLENTSQCPSRGSFWISIERSGVSSCFDPSHVLIKGHAPFRSAAQIPIGSLNLNRRNR